MKRQRYNQGLIKEIALILISVIILSIFGVDLRERVQSPLIQKNLYFVWGTATSSTVWLWSHAVGFSNPKVK